MPKQGSRAEVNTFVKGLITEASPLNFPPNASFDEVNFELYRDGTRGRRMGMDKYSSSFVSSASLTSFVDQTATNTFVWSGVNEDYSKEFLVVQTGTELKFFDLSVSPTPTTPIGAITISGDKSRRFSFATVRGHLVVANGAKSVYSIDYKDGTFNYTPIDLLVRDVWGVEESDASLEADEAIQPTSLSNAHRYNLQNQSWGIPRKNSAGDLYDPAEIYNTDLGKYPSNKETVWIGLQYQPVTGGADPYERIFTNMYVDRRGADSVATKGYYIISLLSRGTSRATASANNVSKYPEMSLCTGFPQDYHTNGPTVVSEYAGRIFYAGFSGDALEGDKRSPSIGNYVAFSQLVQHSSDLAKCYQEGDPTSRDSSDVVDTDGGFIPISGAKKIIAMYPLGAQLIVFATNGIWGISGGNNDGFSATNYKVTKLSSYGCISAYSIVQEGRNLMYWGDAAIYVLAPNPYGDLVANDATGNTIQTLYNAIPDDAKANCQGVYDFYEKKIRWIYRSGQLFSSSSVTKELILDTVLNCFYQHQIATVPTTYEYEIVNIFFTTFSEQNVQYLALHKGVTNGYTFAAYVNTSFKDWNVVDAKAYLLTGAFTVNDSAIAKQAPYITMHMRKTETGYDTDGVPLNTSSCVMRAQWDWAYSVASHKFSSMQEVYRMRQPIFTTADPYDNGFQTVVSKSKLRGKGKAISLYFETSPGKDCKILGWSLTINGNANT